MFARRVAWILIGLVLITLVGACSETPSTQEGESAGADVVSPSGMEDAEYEAVQAPENPEITPIEVIHNGNGVSSINIC